jgi:dipeptidyl aminopeptidase/acylaminoacyl peptidase
MRAIAILAVVVVALVALIWTRPAPTPSSELPQLSYVATAHQLGVVGYRDPAGAISPDGKYFAYAEGRFIRVVPIGGGAPTTLAPGEGQIRYLTWSSNDVVVAEDATPAARWWTYRMSAPDRAQLWNAKEIASADGAVRVSDLRQMTWSADGRSVAALVTTKDGPELWRIDPDGSKGERKKLSGRPSFPAFTTKGEIACIVNARLTIPCGGTTQSFEPDVDVLGPIAFVGGEVYFASPTDHGTVGLWRATLGSRHPRQVASFARDAYAPSGASDGTVAFKVQSYRTFVADVPASGGATRQLATFQSETPSYHPTQPLLSFTYGTWRRVLDDAKYPDIAQEIGTINVTQPLPASQPLEVIAKSDSEDQAMTWSPNGKWIAFHTHREMSDDVWLRPADPSTVALAKADGSQGDKRITFLGRGAEVGWPRWSPDGAQVLLEGARKSDGRSVLYTIGVDQESGATTSDLREIRADGFDAEMGHAEWLGNGTVIAVAKEGPGHHVIVTLPVTGGTPKVVHRYSTEHDFSGLAVSPDGKSLAFAAPANDGFYQIFRKTIAGESTAIQLTSDPSNKTQPAWSPDGSRVAFTIWSYDATFWSFTGK